MSLLLWIERDFDMHCLMGKGVVCGRTSEKVRQRTSVPDMDGKYKGASVSAPSSESCLKN